MQLWHIIKLKFIYRSADIGSVERKIQNRNFIKLAIRSHEEKVEVYRCCEYIIFRFIDA